jgi:cation diffusion facilitator CzcD-associated flavoprotein CzcO
LKYLQDAARDHGLDQNIKLSHRVVGATWDESLGIWQLKVTNEDSGEVFSDWSHFIINGTGFLK